MRSKRKRKRQLSITQEMSLLKRRKGEKRQQRSAMKRNQVSQRRINSFDIIIQRRISSFDILSLRRISMNDKITKFKLIKFKNLF